MNNYYKVVNDFLSIAKQNPFIKGVEYGNIYEQHNSGNIEYNTFTLTQGENSSQTENEITYNFIAFVTDRLLEDKSNLLYVQSACKTILDNILIAFKEQHSGWSIDTETFSFWEEKFNDYCAGCFVNFSVTMPVEFVCEEDAWEQKTLTITSNGTYDVTDYDKAEVNVGCDEYVVKSDTKIYVDTTLWDGEELIKCLNCLRNSFKGLDLAPAKAMLDTKDVHLIPSEAGLLSVTDSANIEFLAEHNIFIKIK